MEFFQSAVDLFSMGVIAFGGWQAAQGGMDYMEGNGNDNAALKNSGGKKLMSGGVIIAIGLLLVPKLADMIHI